MKAIVAALGLAVAIAAGTASGASAAPFAPAAGPSPTASGVELAGGYGVGFGYGYGRPYYGRPHWGPPPFPRYGHYPRPRTRVVQRPCTTKVVERTPWGKYVTVYRTCGPRW